MKKILMSLVLAISTLTVAKPIEFKPTDAKGLAIRLNAGISLGNNYVPGIIGAQAEYDIPVYKINEKTNLEIGPGIDFAAIIYGNNPIFELKASTSFLLANKVNKDLTIKAGLKAGLGVLVNYPSCLGLQNTSLKLGLDYKHFSTSIEGGYSLLFVGDMINLIYPVKLGIGYRF